MKCEQCGSTGIDEKRSYHSVTGKLYFTTWACRQCAWVAFRQGENEEVGIRVVAQKAIDDIVERYDDSAGNVSTDDLADYLQRIPDAIIRHLAREG